MALSCIFRGLSPRVWSGSLRGFWRTCLTSEQLEVGQGLREDSPALLLHRQRNHHQPISQLRKVLDEVVLPVGKSREAAKLRKRRLLGAAG